MYNKSIMVGNLTKDVELKYTPSGLAIGKSSIASSYKYKGQDGAQKEEVCFLEFTMMGRQAEIANQYLRKGSKVLLEGRLVFENERRFDLVVRLDSTYRTDIDDVSNLMIPTNTGNQIPLSQVATISYKLGAAQISRESSKRRIVIGFNVSGRDVQSVVEDIQQKLNEQVKLPTGYYFTYGGQFENLQKASKRLMIAVPVSLFLIFSLLYFTFRSLKQQV